MPLTQYSSCGNTGACLRSLSTTNALGGKEGAAEEGGAASEDFELGTAPPLERLRLSGCDEEELPALLRPRFDPILLACVRNAGAGAELEAAAAAPRLALPLLNLSLALRSLRIKRNQNILHTLQNYKLRRYTPILTWACCKSRSRQTPPTAPEMLVVRERSILSSFRSMPSVPDWPEGQGTMRQWKDQQADLRDAERMAELRNKMTAAERWRSQAETIHFRRPFYEISSRMPTFEPLIDASGIELNIRER